MKSPKKPKLSSVGIIGYSWKVSLVFFTLLFSSIMSQAAVVDVYVYNTEFSINLPGEPIEQAVITAGDSIRWVWVQGGHTTTSVVGSTEVWDELIDSGNTEFARQFNTPGVYWYYCIPHGDDNGDGTASGMAGTITVLSAGSGACCLPDLSCYVTNEADCLSQSGTFFGSGSLCADVACTSTLTLEAVLDNTLYEDPTGSISNGLGSHLFAGNNNGPLIRRLLVDFDLSSIPAGAVIESAELLLYCNSDPGSPSNIDVHRVLSPWGEGTSDANGNESNGDNATTGDATWLHGFYDTDLWSTAGGDFDPAVTATTLVDGSGANYSWQSPALANDVQSMINDPGTAHGWILRGDEGQASTTFRFDSRHSSTVVNRPQLFVSFSIAGTGACCLPDATCYITTEADCLTQGGLYSGDGTSCLDTQCQFELTPYLDPLPLPGVAIPETGSPGDEAHYRIAMTEQLQQLHAELPLTRVWGYNGSYPGPTIEAFRNKTLTVNWVNDLRYVETGELRTEHVLTVDTCLHGPNHTGEVPVAIVHLHGGKVAPESDGDPDLAYPPGDSALFSYPNIQPASTMWYHDHGLGITRLNVMMGMAGFYLLRDSIEQQLELPAGEFEVPLVIQDRSFNSDGSLYYPDEWNEHFFGDVILVNGKVWPFLEVKQGKYRFRVLNGSNSRTYRLSLSNGDSFTQVGTDLGLRETPLVLNELLITPGERSDIIVDFSQLAPGTEIIFENDAPAPFPGFPGVGVIPNVMKFIVTNDPGFTDPIPTSLASITPLTAADADLEREFDLIKIPYAGCEHEEDGMWTINGLMWDDITEFPELGSTEIWTWVNNSGITHPMHMHLVAFQVLDRQAIDVNGDPVGPVLPPEPQEDGWKDTVNCPPGYKTRVIATFSGFTGLFPYHCHILEHEDHEMMRQFEVVAPTILGCTDPSACNYDPDAAVDDGSCILPDGCTDPIACNFDPLAQCDDGTCLLPDGCTDPAACNFDPLAQCDDGTCLLPDGCTDPVACNFDPLAQCDDGTCLLPDGCTDPVACNFDPLAECDDGTCLLPDGCTDLAACNFNPLATCDDGSCEYVSCACLGDLNGDGFVTTADLLSLLSEFGCLTMCQSDLNSDGIVTTADLLILLSVYGSVCSP